MHRRPTLLLALLLLSLSACRGDRDPTGPPAVEPPGVGNRLTGAPDASATGAILERPFIARAEDYAPNHPDLPGIHLSFNTITLVFQASATIAQANSVLEEVRAEIVGGIPGVAGSVAGILFLRLPTLTHAALDSVLVGLRAHPQVRHVARDALAGIDAVPRPNGGTPANWSWDLPPAGGNWGLERIRMPQTWNLNAALQKSGNTTAVGVLDAGFTPNHPDLIPNVVANLTPGIHSNHGTHVAGTIAAVHDNERGVDGVNPFARLTLSAVPAPSGALGVVLDLISWGAVQFNLLQLITHPSDVRVVNISLGYNWSDKGIDSATDPAVATLVADAADILIQMLDILQATGTQLPFLVVAAGNDAGMPARFGSPSAYASLVRNHPAIIVVESVANLEGAPGGTTLSSFSNIDGTLSAPGGEFLPGEQIWSTAETVDYMGMQGTSMASPHVAGLASYLLTLEPDLTHPELRTALLNTRVAAGGGARPRIDAFAAALAVDSLRGNDRVLRMLLDIDDGTADGNRRMNADSTSNTTDAAGDGKIDMGDFRRFRDGLLQVEAPPALALDGEAGHPKRDLNGNGVVGSPAEENVYPRGDFNGDGVISRTATRAVPGFAAPVTDLEVLQRLFDDAHYLGADLSDLLDSGDLVIDAAACLQAGVAEVRSSIRFTGAETAAQTRTHTPDQETHIYSAPVHPGGYTARAEARDSSGVLVASAERDVAIGFGSDHHWRPDCASRLVLELTFPDTIAAGTPAPLTVRVGLQPGVGAAVEYGPGFVVSLATSSGMVAPSTGVTDQEGYMDANVTVQQHGQFVTVDVGATDDEGRTSAAQAVAWVRRAPGQVVPTYFHIRACDTWLEGVENLPANISGTWTPTTGTDETGSCTADVALGFFEEDDKTFVLEGTLQTSGLSSDASNTSNWLFRFHVTENFDYVFEASVAPELFPSEDVNVSVGSAFATLYMGAGNFPSPVILGCVYSFPEIPIAGVQCPLESTTRGILHRDATYTSLATGHVAGQIVVNFRLTLTPRP